MKTDELNSRHITAEEGKVFRRISDQVMFGKEIYLGYTYYLNGEKLEVPLLELPEHFEEIDAPVEDEVILDEVTELLPDEPVEQLPDEELADEPDQPQKVTLSDYRALEEKVAKMMELLGIN
ncbi:hypothetical protein DW083_06170 [Parabacteroides sp. AF48-14]|uniref:hypothetical protein n=1 Tax=Parabacteroides sp. AF48-14 TaxID=2292052 RepID=UPI000F00E5FF|nr:hypothetical protein [Parabacteroides sp. AF48-14]RHO73430.1 hypothetical protein DW083_06170 [Parabacteroides sp. AF48-14]